MTTEGMNWGSIADWVSGLGSFAAVITALYLSRASQRIKLSLSAGPRVIIGGGFPRQDVVSFSATNIGTRATIVTGIGMRTGGYRRKSQRHAIINVPRDSFSDGVPKPLTDGQQGHWSVPIDAQKTWLKEVVDKFLLTHKDVDQLKFCVSTSNGGDIYFAPEEPLKKILKEIVTENSKVPVA